MPPGLFEGLPEAQERVSTGALAQGGISHRRQKTRMGRVKEQYLLWLEAQAEDASYEEAQSRLRMSTLCKDCARELDYPLRARIVELAISAQGITPRNTPQRARSAAEAWQRPTPSAGGRRGRPSRVI